MDIDTPIDLPLPGPVPSLFSLYYPLPFRIAFLSFLTLVGFATNLHILSSLGIDTAQVLDVRLGLGEREPLDSGPASSATAASGSAPASASAATALQPYVHPTRLYPPLYKLGALGLVATSLAYVVYAHGTSNLDRLDDLSPAWRAYPAIVVLGLAAIVVAPWNVACRRQRYMFLRSLRRIVSPNLLRPVPFCDVILADILTSSAKVLGDVWLAGCFVFERGQGWGIEGCGKVWGVPLMVSLPYMFRFRQCLSEVLTGQSPLPRRSLLNALKYATAFPVILLSAMQTVVGDPFDDDLEGGVERREELGERWIGRTTLFYLWVLAVLINSLYSFWWDVTNDWGLSLLVPSGWSSKTAHQSAYHLVPRHAPSTVPARSTASEPALHTRSRSTLAAGGPLGPSSSSSLLHPSPTLPSAPSSSSSLSPHRGAGASRHSRAFSTAASPNVTYPFLRPILLLPDPTIYYLAIVIDLLLRLTWSLKLSPHLHQVGEVEEGVFGMEVLEVLRRWGWVYLRVEWEAVRKGQGGSVVDSLAGGGGGIEIGERDRPYLLDRGESERRLRLHDEYDSNEKLGGGGGHGATRNGATPGTFAAEEELIGLGNGPAKSNGNGYLGTARARGEVS